MSTAAVQTGASPPYSDPPLQSFQQQTVQEFGRNCLKGQLFTHVSPPSPVYVSSTTPDFVPMSQVPQQNSGIVYQRPVPSPFNGPHNPAPGLGPVLYGHGHSISPVLYNYGTARLPSPFGPSKETGSVAQTTVHEFSKGLVTGRAVRVCSYSPPVHTATFTPNQYRRNSGPHGPAPDSSVERDRPQQDIDMQNRERTQEMNEEDIMREVQRDKNKKNVRSMNRKTKLPPLYSKKSSSGTSDGIFTLELEHDTPQSESGEELKDSPGARRKTPTSLQAHRSSFNMSSEPWRDDARGQFSRMEPLPSQDLSRRAQYDHQHKHGRERQRPLADGSFRGSPRGDAELYSPRGGHRRHAPMHPPPRAGYDLSPAFESHPYPPPPDIFSNISHHFDERGPPPPGWDRRGFVTDPYEPSMNRRYKSKPTRRAGKKVKMTKQQQIEAHIAKNKNSQAQNYRQKQNLCDQVEKQLEAIPGWDGVKSKMSYRGADVLFLQIKVPAALKQIVKMMEEIMELRDEHGIRQLQNLHMNVQLKKKKLKKGFLLYLKFKTEEQVEAIIKDVWPKYSAIPRCEKAVFQKNTSKPNQGKKSDDGDAQIGGCVREVAAPVAVNSKLCDFVDMKAREKKLVDGRLGQGGEAGSHAVLGTTSTLV